MKKFFESKKFIFLAIGLAVVFGVLYFVPAIRNIWKEFELSKFFGHPFFLVLCLFFFGLLLHFLLKKYKKTGFVFIAESLVTASVIGMLIEVPHIKRLLTNTADVNVNGDWFYEVQDGNNRLSHGGICSITQNHDGSLIIEGWRKFQQRKTNEMVLDRTHGDGIHWSTQDDFALLYGGENKSVAFVYTIRLDNIDFKGYCHLQVITVKDDTTELVGTYYHLAPGTLRGNIRFIRMTKSEAEDRVRQQMENSQKSFNPDRP